MEAQNIAVFYSTYRGRFDEVFMEMFVELMVALIIVSSTKPLKLSSPMLNLIKLSKQSAVVN